MRALAASDVVGVLLPASALFLGRPMPPARALVDAGAAVALATDFNPGQRVLREPPARLLARVHAARALAGGGACARAPSTPRTCSACADRKGRIAPGFDADLVLLDAPDWRYLAYHLGGDVVAGTIAAAAPRSYPRPVPSRKQRKKRQKELRHEYEFVVVDEDGREVEVDPEELKAKRAEKERTAKASSASGANGRARSGTRDARGRPIREIKPPSWQRTLEARGAFTAVMFLALSFLAHGGSLAGRLMLTLGYGVLFVPFLYFMDRWQYNQYQRRIAAAEQAPAARRAPTRTPKPDETDKPSRRGLRRSSRT